MERLATTPFGGARFSAANFVRQNQVSYRQEQLRAGDGGNDTGTADKWQLIRALTEARHVYGLSDRSISLLEALLSFHQERQIDGKEPVIVFPSNDELSLRCRGMSEATLRRHLAALVEAGMIFRRDSANGKRYCRRTESGEVEDAFGFDLAPFALKADEIYTAAEEARAEAKRSRALRGEITVLSRDISKIITLALEEQRAGQWDMYLLDYQALRMPTGRQIPSQDLQDLALNLNHMLAEVENAYLSSLSELELSGNDDRYERLHQNSNTDLQSDINGKEHIKAAAPTDSETQKRAVAISLSKFTSLCPQIADYAKDGITGWQDVFRAADVVRTMLGVSPDAWLKARQTMGEQAAAIAIAVMLERADTIRSAGGYLRTLTEKAEQAQFSVYPMLQALEKNRRVSRDE